MSKPLDYFPNEKGDYTITLHDEPIAVCFTESDAIKLKNSFSGLTLRIDTLTKTLKNNESKALEYGKAKWDESAREVLIAMNGEVDDGDIPKFKQ